ncbi:hypothetical protein K227x_01620 [Rubripirellula lacrimiformis]|uniref:Uncharacterized protein n=1 Tax=Rubripirellula lacrimiformis TaxID=1930273 RepID=A0A517N3T6_9BACT|nr:hypothetical protein [Rubripirellula lacrimiformis]QDT01794.1 hypothetical protein K227x_01620 [Rubripirellula lacrimiformis]
MMRSWVKRIALVALGIGLLAGGAAWWALQQTQFVPEFYTRAASNRASTTVEASRRLQAEVEQLQSNVAKIGSWRAAFSDEQINAWLIEELPNKFPRLAALGASEPRIVIEDERVLAAVRYRHGGIDTVVSCEFRVELTEEPNMLAFRVQNLRAGSLPLPLSKFQRGISKEAARGDIDIHWDMTETGPIALVTVPSEDPRYSLSPVVVESLMTYDGALLLSGHTGEWAHHEFQPKGPVHQFVSYRPGTQRNDQSPRISSERSEPPSTIR